MEKPALLPNTMVAARNYSQQLKVIVNLPVRLITENQVVDVLPLKDDPLYVPKKIRKGFAAIPYCFYTPNQLIDFFNGCMKDELFTTAQVADIYQVTRRTVKIWANKGLLVSYRLAPSLTLYKRGELPTLEQLYGPFEL